MIKNPKVSLLFKSLSKVWAVVGRVLLLLVIIEAGSYLVWQVFEQKKGVNSKAYLEIYKDVDWSVDYWTEHDLVLGKWRPYVHFVSETFNGKYINIDENGVRASKYKPFVSPALDEKRIFFFGGSVMWGFGTPDSLTIPSMVGGKMSEREMPSEVVNFGQNGWASTQEVVQLMLELKKGNIPDYVVFLDGINEVMNAAYAGRPGGIQSEVRFSQLHEQVRGRSQRFTNNSLFKRTMQASSAIRLLNKFMEKIGAKLVLFSPEEVNVLDFSSDELINDYFNNVELVEHLGRAYGFTPIFFWQPILANRQNKFEEEVFILQQQQARAGELLFGNLIDTYDEFRSRSWAGKSVYNLDTLFDQYKHPAFMDMAHLTHLGNDEMANVILENCSKIW